MLDQLQPLTLSQYEQCKDRASEIIKAKVGEKPRRKDYKIDYASTWDILSLFGLVLFLGAFAVSSLHVIAYSGERAAHSYQSLPVGIDVGIQSFTIIHQLGFMLLAESAMILFFVMHEIMPKRLQYQDTKLGTVQLYLALLAAIFVVVANLSSGLNPLLSVLAPAFTIGGGFLIEDKIKTALEQKRETDQRYREALHIYESASIDITAHPDYEQTLKLAIWDNLVRLKANKHLADAENSFKRAAVERELQRERWTTEPAPELATPTYPKLHLNGNGKGGSYTVNIADKN